MNTKRRTLAVLAAVIPVLGLALGPSTAAMPQKKPLPVRRQMGTIPLCSFFCR